MAEMNRGLPWNFVSSRSICNRNISIGAKGLWEWGSKLIKCFQVVFSISRQKGAGRGWWER